MRAVLKNPFSFVRLAAVGAVGVACAACAANAQDSVRRILLDRQMRVQTVDLLEIDSKTIRYSDESGLLRSEPVDQFLAILPAVDFQQVEGSSDAAGGIVVQNESGDATAGAFVELTDGQRLVGRPALDASADLQLGDDEIAWSHPAFGTVALSLEDVSRVVLIPAGGLRALADLDDVAVLTNGDRVRGFIESIGRTVRIETGGSVIELPLDRVAELALANPDEQPEGMRAWLSDGSAVSVSEVRTSRSGELILEIGARVDESELTGHELRLADLVAVSVDASRFTPLGTIEIQSTEPIGRRWTPAPRVEEPGKAVLSAAAIELPGPMAVTWVLPGAARGISGWAELPASSRTWGDCELVILESTRGVEVELFRERLNAEDPVARFSASFGDEDAGERTLIIRLEPGEHGPIQDRAILHRALILLDGFGG